MTFSGGFDSVAALAILGEGSVNLVSNDFGGAFEREAKFFGEFNPTVFEWKLRGRRPDQAIRFNEATDWRFMISLPLLYKRDGAPLFVGTGALMHSGPFWYSDAVRSDFSRYSPYGLGPGVATLNPVSCASELLTTKVALKYLGPSLLDRSLNSLAPVGSFKRYRKEVLVSLARCEAVPSAPSALSLHEFGKGFSDDIKALYFVWRLGLDWVRANYCFNIPDSSKYVDMSFFESVNTNNLKSIQPDLSGRIVRSFRGFGITSFGPFDLKRLGVSKIFLDDN